MSDPSNVRVGQDAGDHAREAADTKRPKPLAADTVTTPSRFDKPSNRNSEVPASSGARASPAGASEKAGDAPAGASKSDEDEEDCPFCVFMRGGGCGDAFRSWEKCVDENRGSADGFASKCGPATQALQECMEKAENKEYYAPMLQEEAEFAAEQAGKNAEAEKQRAGSGKEAEQHSSIKGAGASVADTKAAKQAGGPKN